MIPHAYFGWTEGNPIAYLLKFLVFGEGDTAPVTREVLRQTEETRAKTENSRRVTTKTGPRARKPRRHKARRHEARRHEATKTLVPIR